jgi:hypothetical protein
MSIAYSPFAHEEEGEASNDDKWETLEILHTNTTYYLAQAYGALKLQDKSAEYCRLTLEKQLKRRNLNALTWALDCMTLSQYFTQKNAFRHGYQCLSSSDFMLTKVQIPDTVTEEDPLVRTKADVAWIWGKFYLRALEISAERRANNDDLEEDLR